METAATGWFAIITAHLCLRKITYLEINFYNVLLALPSELVTNIHFNKKNFEELKEAVISSYEKTKLELFEKPIYDTKMTGQPSLSLRELMATANKVGVQEDLVRHHFTQAMPSRITSVIAAVRNLTLYEFGSLADELLPFMKTDMVQNTISAC